MNDLKEFLVYFFMGWGVAEALDRLIGYLL